MKNIQLSPTDFITKIKSGTLPNDCIVNGDIILEGTFENDVDIKNTKFRDFFYIMNAEIKKDLNFLTRPLKVNLLFKILLLNKILTLKKLPLMEIST